MTRDTFDAVLTSVPLNGTAGRVTSRGTHYEQSLKQADHIYSSDIPPPMRKVADNPKHAGLVGTKCGRLTVIGCAANYNPKKEAGWVVRCVCGTYEIRKAKAIRNPKNTEDACRKCRDWAHKKEAYKRLGPKPIETFIEGKS